MPTLFKNGKNYSGTSVSLTQAEYDALTETQKNDGTVYFITDSDAVLDASDVALGSGTVETLAGSIATIEKSPATANHSVGEYIVYNGQLYKVTTAITAGTTLTGKISAVSVGDEINSLNSYSSGTNGSVRYRKSGRIVDITIASSAISDYNKWITLGTLPEGYRPIVEQYFTGYDNSANTATLQKVALEMQIKTTGEVQVWPLVANSIPRGSKMFIAI